MPEDVVAGEHISLEYMPVSFILRAVGAPWVLTRDCLPRLPESMPLNGLFQLRPTQVYFRRVVAADKFINIRRTQFAVMPADTKVVHSAQGEMYDAVVTDMLRPPRMDHDTYWLACYVMPSSATSI